jgi:hypothetical protein
LRGAWQPTGGDPFDCGAVYAPDAVQLEASLDRNGHGGHEHEQNRLHEQPTLLEK